MKNRFIITFALIVVCVVSVVAVSPSLASAAKGDYCRAPGNTPGHINSSGQCVPDEMVGQSCGPDMYYDSNRDCVSECQRKQVGGICNAGGKAGHCDSSLQCVVDPNPECQIKKVGGICDANNLPGHCDSSLQCIADPLDSSGTDFGSSDSSSSGSPDFGSADSNTGGGTITLINPLGSGGATLEGFLNSILDFVIRIGAIVVILMLVYIGFMFVKAQGKEADIRAAREALLWTVVGALILIGAKVIAVGIEATVKALSVGN